MRAHTVIRIFLQSLDEADIALLKSYGQGQYTKAIKVSSLYRNHEQIVNCSCKSGAGSGCSWIRIMICDLLGNIILKGTAKNLPSILFVNFLFIYENKNDLVPGYRICLKVKYNAKIKKDSTVICVDAYTLNYFIVPSVMYTIGG